MSVIPKYMPVLEGAELPANALTCDLCHKPAFEVRPFGPNQESICEDCSKLDPATTDRHWRGGQHEHEHEHAAFLAAKTPVQNG